MKAGIILLVSILFLVVGCNTTKNQQTTQKEKAKLLENIQDQKYTFVPRSANPTGGRTVQLSLGYYSLKVTPDTIESYLPYFGRAYVAPMPTDEGGIKFTSTDFDYQIKEGKDNWQVTIITNDTPSRVKMYLNIGKTGYGSLSVQDNNRQPISFSGAIE